MWILAQQVQPNEPALYGLLAFMIALAMLPTALWFWTLYDCLKNEPPGSQKTTWVIVIIFLGVIGAMAYSFSRKKQRIREYGR
ncbi:MAG: PLD nuclease N-terminal domain-containing protein [Pirellulales bacterium]